MPDLTTLTERIDAESLSLLSAGLLLWVALVYMLMALGLRRGELVWTGRYPRMLPSHLRRRSLAYSVLLIWSAWVLAAFGDRVGIFPAPNDWHKSAGWIVTTFLAVAAVLSFLRGSRWERFLFAPILLIGAILAGWFTFFLPA
jgi:hypothetical protein